MTKGNLQDLLDQQTKQQGPGRPNYYAMSDETKSAIREKRKLQAPTFLGKTHSDESRAKISASNTGKVSWNKGKTHTEEHVSKIATALTGTTRPADVCAKISAGAKGHEVTQATRDKIRNKLWANAKSVMTPNGLFPSTGAVASAAGVSSNTVRRWMQKYPKHYYYVDKCDE